MSFFDAETPDRQILQTDRVTYYASRAPDGNCILAAKTNTAEFTEKIERLQARYSEVMRAMGFSSQVRCNPGRCRQRRTCPQVNYLPQISTIANTVSGDTCELRFSCFNFGELVLAQDLVEAYDITAPTACRLMVSLLALVEWLVRLNLKVDLSVNNLLIDIPSSTVTLIDWSEAKIVDILSINEITTLYQQAAKVMMTLIGAEQNEDDSWSYLAEPLDIQMSEFFKLLRKIIGMRVEMPTKLSEAISYIQVLRKKQKDLVLEVADILKELEVESKRPWFEVVQKVEGQK